MASSHHHHQHHPLTHHLLPRKLVTWILYALIPLALLHYYLFLLPTNQTPSPDHLRQTPTSSNSSSSSSSSSSSYSSPQNHQNPHPTTRRRCDYSDGRWLRDDRAPLYTGMSCATIKSNQNCMANGRPDSGYLHWRWQPSQCDLPRFDPSSFLSQIRNKHLAFVGDSMARNQLESLLCLLATASSPALVYRDGEDNKFRRWSFQSHNATVSVFWSPFLVKAIEKSEELGVKHNRVYLDSFDERWTSELDHIDIVIFSFGHWFLNPGIYHENNLTLGCHYCPEFNHTEIGFFGVFRKALKNVLNEVRRQSGLRSEKLVAVTTFSPAHFDGEWDKLGACPNKEPYKEGDKEVEYMDKEMRRIAVEEVAIAANEVGRNGVRFEALDVTKLATMRADGHPGPYMYKDPFAAGVKDRVQNDCVHWCLPGPIDTFNQILLHLIKR